MSLPQLHVGGRDSSQCLTSPLSRSPETIRSARALLYSTSSKQAYGAPNLNSPLSFGGLTFGAGAGKDRHINSTFSSEFRTGSYRDSSLGSLRRMKLNAKRNEEKAKERYRRIIELRKKVEASRESLRRARRERAAAHRMQTAAARIIQKRAKFFLKRQRLFYEKVRADKEKCAAIIVQTQIRRYVARIFVETRRGEMMAGSKKISTFLRSVVEIRKARQELERRRAVRDAKRQEMIRIYLDKNACVIQRHTRARLARNRVRRMKDYRTRQKQERIERLKQKRLKAMQKAERKARSKRQKGRYAKGVK